MQRSVENLISEVLSVVIVETDQVLICPHLIVGRNGIIRKEVDVRLRTADWLEDGDAGLEDRAIGSLDG